MKQIENHSDFSNQQSSKANCRNFDYSNNNALQKQQLTQLLEQNFERRNRQASPLYLKFENLISLNQSNMKSPTKQHSRQYHDDNPSTKLSENDMRNSEDVKVCKDISRPRYASTIEIIESFNTPAHNKNKLSVDEKSKSYQQFYHQAQRTQINDGQSPDQKMVTHFTQRNYFQIISQERNKLKITDLPKVFIIIQYKKQQTIKLVTNPSGYSNINNSSKNQFLPQSESQEIIALQDIITQKEQIIKDLQKKISHNKKTNNDIMIKFQKDLQIQIQQLNEQKQTIQKLNEVINKKNVDFHRLNENYTHQLELKNIQIIQMNKKIDSYGDISYYQNIYNNDSISQAVITCTNSVAILEQSFIEKPTQKFISFSLQEILNNLNTLFINKLNNNIMNNSINQSFQQKNQNIQIFQLIDLIKLKVTNIQNENIKSFVSSSITDEQKDLIKQLKLDNKTLTLRLLKQDLELRNLNEKKSHFSQIGVQTEIFDTTKNQLNDSENKQTIFEKENEIKNLFLKVIEQDFENQRLQDKLKNQKYQIKQFQETIKSQLSQFRYDLQRTKNQTVKLTVSIKKNISQELICFENEQLQNRFLLSSQYQDDIKLDINKQISTLNNIIEQLKFENENLRENISVQINQTINDASEEICSLKMNQVKIIEKNQVLYRTIYENNNKIQSFQEIQNNLNRNINQKNIKINDFEKTVIGMEKALLDQQNISEKMKILVENTNIQILHLEQQLLQEQNQKVIQSQQLISIEASKNKSQQYQERQQQNIKQQQIIEQEKMQNLIQKFEQIQSESHELKQILMSYESQNFDLVNQLKEKDDKLDDQMNKQFNLLDQIKILIQEKNELLGKQPLIVDRRTLQSNKISKCKSLDKTKQSIIDSKNNTLFESNISIINVNMNANNFNDISVIEQENGDSPTQLIHKINNLQIENEQLAEMMAQLRDEIEEKEQHEKRMMMKIKSLGDQIKDKEQRFQNSDLKSNINHIKQVLLKFIECQVNSNQKDSQNHLNVLSSLLELDASQKVLMNSPNMKSNEGNKGGFLKLFK